MDKQLFSQLTESMGQMGEITRGERAPARESTVDSELQQEDLSE